MSKEEAKFSLFLHSSLLSGGMRSDSTDASADATAPDGGDERVQTLLTHLAHRRGPGRALAMRLYDAQVGAAMIRKDQAKRNKDAFGLACIAFACMLHHGSQTLRGEAVRVSELDK